MYVLEKPWNGHPPGTQLPLGEGVGAILEVRGIAKKVVEQVGAPRNAESENVNDPKAATHQHAASEGSSVPASGDDGADGQHASETGGAGRKVRQRRSAKKVD